MEDSNVWGSRKPGIVPLGVVSNGSQYLLIGADESMLYDSKHDSVESVSHRNGPANPEIAAWTGPKVLVWDRGIYTRTFPKPLYLYRRP